MVAPLDDHESFVTPSPVPSQTVIGLGVAVIVPVPAGLPSAGESGQRRFVTQFVITTQKIIRWINLRTEERLRK